MSHTITDNESESENPNVKWKADKLFMQFEILQLVSDLENSEKTAAQISKRLEKVQKYRNAYFKHLKESGR